MSGGGSARSRAQDREAAKVRRQKIFVGVGGVAMLGLVGFQMKGLVFSSSKPSTPVAAVAVPLATPVSSPVKLPAALTHGKQRDLYIAQVTAGASTPSNADLAITPTGPTVRLKSFVNKDVFRTQVTVPSAPLAQPAGGTATPQAPAQGSVPAATETGGSYIVVLKVIPGVGSASQLAAARAIVAAKNAGLKEVTANSSTPGTTQQGEHYTVFTGPYPSQATAQDELVRALRNGYPDARPQQLAATTSGGY
jgi:hypothetical protein